MSDGSSLTSSVTSLRAASNRSCVAASSVLVTVSSTDGAIVRGDLDRSGDVVDVEAMRPGARERERSLDALAVLHRILLVIVGRASGGGDGGRTGDGGGQGDR